jgi:glycosyltransferase involved in cell wall biosynthesis
MKKKLLWVGDAACETGFARITHHVLDVLRDEWDVSVLGVNYHGDPHDYPYDIYPTSYADPFGFRRLGKLATKIKPDCIFLLTDPWHIPTYLKEAGNCPAIASVAVDGKNCRGRGMNGLVAAIFWTEFAATEAGYGGFQGKAAVIPLGVDTEIYRPFDRSDARKALALPPGLHDDGFIVGNVNRNSPRKWLDLTVAYFAEWVRSNSIDDAYLYLHLLPTGGQGWDIAQLVQYYGITNRLIYPPKLGQLHGVPEAALSMTYSAFDVNVTTTQGEGFGLTTLEASACGIPAIVPNWSALGEIYADGGALLVPCTSYVHTPNHVNAVGGMADREKWIGCLDRTYREPALREKLGAEGIELANRQCYRWPEIGALYGSVIDQSLAGPSVRILGNDGEDEATRRRTDGEAATVAEPEVR